MHECWHVRSSFINGARVSGCIVNSQQVLHHADACAQVWNEESGQQKGEFLVVSAEETFTCQEWPDDWCREVNNHDKRIKTRTAKKLTNDDRLCRLIVKLTPGISRLTWIDIQARCKQEHVNLPTYLLLFQRLQTLVFVRWHGQTGLEKLPSNHIKIITTDLRDRRDREEWRCDRGFISCLCCVFRKWIHVLDLSQQIRLRRMQRLGTGCSLSSWWETLLVFPGCYPLNF